MELKKYHLGCAWCNEKTTIEASATDAKDLWRCMLAAGWWYRTDPGTGNQKPVCPACRERLKALEGGKT